MPILSELFSIVFVVFMIFLDAFTVTKAWLWLMVPAIGVPPLPMAAAICASIIFAMFNSGQIFVSAYRLMDMSRDELKRMKYISWFARPLMTLSALATAFLVSLYYF